MEPDGRVRSLEALGYSRRHTAPVAAAGTARSGPGESLPGAVALAVETMRSGSRCATASNNASQRASAAARRLPHFDEAIHDHIDFAASGGRYGLVASATAIM